MRLVTYDRGGARRLGAWVADAVVDLPDAVGHPAFPSTMEALVARNGGTTLDAARDAIEHPAYVEEFTVPDARLLAPFLPPAFRRLRHVLGPDDEVPWPGSGRSIDCRAQLACVVGQPGHDLSEKEAASVIFGYTLMTSWSAGDWSAVSVGPCVATPEEALARNGRVVARADGELLSEADLSSARGALPGLVARESAGRILFPGDMIGSVVGSGGQERANHGLRPGSVVELEAEGLGILRNRIGPAAGGSR
jgi:2-keto-4-pentenoate hydratase/2-oxohepta-3-ene-1,7-dioic acid hydratase in catechol pathway